MSTEVIIAIVYVLTLTPVVGLTVVLCRAARMGDEVWEDALSQKRFAPMLDGMGDEFDEVTWVYPDLTCPQCEGDGVLIFLGNWPDPQSEDSARCPTCHGEGVVSA